MPSDLLESDPLRAFATFAESCNFTTAARALHISQPALHVKIQKLSAAIGERLYERSGRELFLTPEGAALALFATAQHAGVQDFIAELKGTEKRPITLACGRGAFQYVIHEGIARAIKKHLTLSFIMGNTPELIEMVLDGSADVAVGVFDHCPSRLSRTALGSYGQNLIVKQSDPLSRLSKLTIRDLNGMALALPPGRWPQRIEFERRCGETGTSFDVAVEVPGWDLLLQMAKLGVAPALVNSCVSPLPGLVAIPIDGLPAVTYSALTRSSAHPRVADFVQLLTEHVR